MSNEDGGPADAREVAARIAADETGLSGAQIVAAVAAYRRAVAALTDEPVWKFEMHMTGKDFAMAVYGAAGTDIKLQIESSVERGKWVEDGRCYTFDGRAFETFVEAAEAENRHRRIFPSVNVVHMLAARKEGDTHDR